MSDPNVFISWSGDRSYRVAEALWSWLPKVLQSTQPWMSAKDIEKGSRWFDEVSKTLEKVQMGIFCLTPENLTEPWLLFEAGALSKKLDQKTRLCTYLFGGLGAEDVTPPLSMFQATRVDRDDTRELLRSINRAVNVSLIPEQNLDELFEAMWPKLEAQLAAIPEPNDKVEVKRPTGDMIAEILEITRSQAMKRAQFDQSFGQFEPILSDLMPFLAEVLRQAKRQQGGGGTLTIVQSPHPGDDPSKR